MDKRLREDMMPIKFSIDTIEEEEDDEALAELTDSASMRERLKQLLIDCREDMERGEAPQEVVNEGVVEMFKDEEDGTEIVLKVSKKKESKMPPNPSVAKKNHLQFKLSPSQKVENVLSRLSVAFGQVFQGLLALSQMMPLNNAENVAEAERLGKRNREFEVRINRMTFELKQKVSRVRATFVRLTIRPDDNALQNSADDSLHRALRISETLLKAYAGHLPLSGGLLYPACLDGALSGMLDAAGLCSQLGYRCEELEEDIKKLVKAREKWKVIKEKAGEAKDEEVTKKEVAAPVVGLIDNLAREKFGKTLPKSPKKTNVLSKPKQIILPRENAVQRERAKLARAKRGSEGKSEKRMDAPTDEMTILHDLEVMKTMMEGVMRESHDSAQHRKMSCFAGKKKIGKTRLTLDAEEKALILRCSVKRDDDCFSFHASSRDAASDLTALTDRLMRRLVREVCQEATAMLRALPAVQEGRKSLVEDVLRRELE